MSDEEDKKPIERQHDELCAMLTVDEAARHSSWVSYTTIANNYMLEGEPLHWLACALYVACRTSITPTVQGGSAVEGNCVSLTKLLRLSNISLIQFFNKIKKWMGMASMSEEFTSRIERLERKFAVSTVLFHKFQPIFQDVFVGLSNEPAKTPSKGTKKPKLVPCTTNALFEFTWCLFISVKGEFHSSAHDLVDMYHVLLSCLDFVFANAYVARRTDLINPKFAGLPAEWNDKESLIVPMDVPCVIGALCRTREGLPLEATTTKQYSWRPVIQSFFNKNILRGDKNTLTGILDVVNFDANLKSLNNLYETYVLSVGEFDERIFLGEHANSEVGTTSGISGDEFTKTIATFGTSGRSLAPDTPLTGRRYLRTVKSEPLTPVSAATQSVARLQAYLSGCKPQLSAHLKALFTECDVSDEVVQSCVVEPCRAWADQFLSCYREATVASNETALARCNMITTLHYKILEHILREERRKKPQVPLQSLLSQEIFQATLYACCAEMVLHAYGTHSVRFPWVLHTFRLHAFYFYKIIELTVQAVMDKLSRDIVKHLNSVEEQALESLVWATDSPLWERLAEGAVPASSNVYSAHDASASPGPAPTPPHNASATAAARRRVIAAGSGGGGLQSPVSTVSERFLSPNAELAKKQLFKDTPSCSIRPGQSLLVQGGSSVIMSNGAASAMCESAQEAAPAPSSASTSTTSTAPATDARKSSLVLFFRKFYSLAVVRMSDMCTRLRLTDSELKRKIWTCLEYSVMHQTQLMKDRHLDQILMCAIYVICKVSNNSTSRLERSFTDIMRCYRQQPQADNHVYRSVLIQGDNPDDAPERGDLIKFYNKVYVKYMQAFAMRFTGRQKDECSLSPLPAGRGGACGSPAGQRVSDRHHLYVKPLLSPPPADNQLTYRFSRSPAKDLRAINTMLSCEVSVSGVKRAAEGGVESVKRVAYGAPGVARKLHGLITDRQAV